MNDELLALYNAELAYLRELGTEFARKYPKVAGRLALEEDRCEDPHVERLLEGVAFLTARVRKKLDDELPEITDAFLSVLYPHYQRPLPSMAIAQMAPIAGSENLTTGFRVEAGSVLVSRPVGGQPCRFRTVYPLVLHPIEITAAKLDPDRVVLPHKPAGAVAMLQLSLRCTGAATFEAAGLDTLRLHLDGDGPTPFALYETLNNNLSGIYARWTGDGGRVETLPLPAAAVHPVGFGREEGMFPYPARSFPGYRLLQEYFSFPEKFLFVDVAGLNGLAGRCPGAELDLLFFFDTPPRAGVRVQTDHFRLGCVPIVNLFETTCEPIALDARRAEYRVVPHVQHPLSHEVYSIDSVTGGGGFLDEPVRYEPFFALGHGGDPVSAYWFASRHPSARKDDPGTEVDLTFVDRQFNPRAPASRVATVRATCTNRDLPSRLPFGGDQGVLELEAPGPVARARLLRKPTTTIRPPLGRGAQWRLISHLALNHLSLTGSDEGLAAFREILRLADFADSAVTRQQIEGITQVASRRAAGRTGCAIGNAVCLGVEVELVFDESRYVGSGVYLFASVLERFLGLYTSLNSFTRLVARTRQREGILRRWPPRSGERTLL